MTNPQPIELEAVSDACFTYLVSAPEELARFMDYSGYAPDSLQAAMGSPDLARGMLDYVVANEPILMAVCANSGLNVERVMHLWQRMNQWE